ncbi:MAG: CarD family transcriptional regulator [Oscillospiraceae bacterium]
MYQPGDLIVYGGSGVCRVIDVGKPNFHIADSEKLYYKLLPIYSSETIYTPVDTCVFMRPVISQEEAEKLISEIPSIKENFCDNQKPSLLTAHYKESFESHNCKDLMQLIKTIYTKNQEAAQNKKQMGQTDQHFMALAEDLLYGELAVALGIERENVLEYIENVVSPIREELEVE